MEDKNLNQRIKPNRTEPTDRRTEPTDEARQPIPDDRHFNISISPYLHISTSSHLLICVPIYARLPVCPSPSLCKCIGAQRPLRTYTSLPLPPPIWERENLGSLSSIFFEIFFFEIFFCRISRGSFLWLCVFLRECIF